MTKHVWCVALENKPAGRVNTCIGFGVIQQYHKDGAVTGVSVCVRIPSIFLWVLSSHVNWGLSDSPSHFNTPSDGTVHLLMFPLLLTHPTGRLPSRTTEGTIG